MDLSWSILVDLCLFATILQRTGNFHRLLYHYICCFPHFSSRAFFLFPVICFVVILWALAVLPSKTGLRRMNILLIQSLRDGEDLEGPMISLTKYSSNTVLHNPRHNGAAYAAHAHIPPS